MSTLFEWVHGCSPDLVGPYFGVEVEAERLPDDEYQRMMDGDSPAHPLLRENEFRRRWGMVRDGSLRHNGVEFVSGRIHQPLVLDTVRMIPPLFEAGLVRTNPRAGIHVHCNAGDWEPDYFVQFLQTYLLTEPLYFQLAGQDRAHNIYCVPLYSTTNELNAWRLMAQAIHKEDHATFRGALRSACKYSAMFVGPLRDKGSIEFRHAPTWDTEEPLVNWVRFVMAMSRIRLNPENEESVYTLPELLPDFPLDWDAYFREVEDRGLYNKAQSLLPCTYKVSQWGSPAGLSLDSTVAEKRVDSRIAPHSYRGDLTMDLFGGEEDEPEYSEEEEEYEVHVDSITPETLQIPQYRAEQLAGVWTTRIDGDIFVATSPEGLREQVERHRQAELAQLRIETFLNERRQRRNG